MALSARQAVAAALRAKVLMMADGQMGRCDLCDFASMDKSVRLTDDDLRGAANDVMAWFHSSRGIVVAISVISSHFSIVKGE
jgi:hypothetical protein